ncbi:peptidase family M20/M25/M40 protein [Aspergillus lucknowensis]|uniref:Peptidase family M20/M25/M40 protein n=1 Tax=Aspergillus lucknowensis TaxID=176173 RepID=A0ABR4M843_9EURO
MAFNTKPPQPSVSERRGQQLAPLQTNIGRPTSKAINVASPRTQRPRPPEYDSGESQRVPLQPARVKRQSSRSSLRNIFSREKSGRKSTDAKLAGIDEVQDHPVKQAPAGTMSPLSPRSCDTPRATTSTPAPATPSLPPDTPRGRFQQIQRSKTTEEDQPPAEDAAWKPPPLFKAYPQGLKHITLPAPSLSGDSIMRLHATFKAKGASLQDDDQKVNHGANGEPSEDSAARKKKLDKEKRKYLRALSNSIEKSEWSLKIYIITTSGYILQYSGDGKHDRLPEKMLLLGPRSVAFASDAIPGKHWVLQVSQCAEEGSSSTNRAETSRPLLSRLGFHRSHARRLAQTFLLVFNDPEELSSWLLAVRAQIESRGGKKYVSERVYDEGMESQLRTTPSMRQMVKKDPNRISTVFLQPQQSMVFEDKDSTVGDQSRRSSYISLHRRSTAMLPAPESRSGSVSTARTEAMSNAEESGYSYTTFASPPLPDSTGVSETASSVTGPASPTFSSPKKRRSMFLPPMTNPEITEIPRAQSTAPNGHSRSTSPPAPNFSVPVFSKRFTARQDIPQVPHLPPGHSDHYPDDASIDTLSMLSSPPQSPKQEGFASSQIDPREQRRPLDRRDLLKKQLRASNSEDALGNLSRDRDRSRLRYSHLPEHITITPSAPNVQHPAAPPSPVNAMPPVPTANPRPPKTSNAESSSSRPSSLVISRRKSLNGLTIGPPSAPPPNCPLPKIPSAFIKPSPQSSWPDHSPPISPVEDAERTIATITPIDSSHTRPPRAPRSVTSRRMNHKT